jgi:acetyl esterase/lipase
MTTVSAPRAGHRFLFLFCVLFAAFAQPTHAAGKESLQFTAIPTPRDVYAIPLRKSASGPPGPPQANGQEQWEQAGDLRIVRNVTQATITPVLPDAEKASGAAVIVAPGGAFLMVSIDNEGYKVARWLADHGVAALVLKYRTEPTPADDVAFQTALKRRVGEIAAKPTASFPGEALAVEDAIDALRVARARAGEMGVDPARIGFLGFSVGARAALRVALDQDPSLRPLFVASVYGPMQSRPVVTDAPPLFIAHTQDDNIFRIGDLGLARAWKKAGSPVELHVFERGGHGFGASQQGAPSDHWLDEFYWWLSARGVLKAGAK